jgi:hypothetical protein
MAQYFRNLFDAVLEALPRELLTTEDDAIQEAVFKLLYNATNRKWITNADIVLESIGAQLPNFVPEHFDVLALTCLTPAGPLLEAILNLGPRDNPEVVKAMFSYLGEVLKNEAEFFWGTIPPQFIFGFLDGGTVMVQELVIDFMNSVGQAQTPEGLLIDFVRAFLEWFPRVDRAVRPKMMEFFMSAVSVYPARQGIRLRPFMGLEDFWRVLGDVYGKECAATQELFTMLGALSGVGLPPWEVRRITAPWPITLPST